MYYCNDKMVNNSTELCSGFNTANGKNCYLITFVLPSLRSGTCNVWISSSLRSSAASHSAAHTASGRYCCNAIILLLMFKMVLRFNTASGRYCYLITFVLPSLRSGTCDVWTSSSRCSSAASHSAAHTASGRYYCNVRMKSAIEWLQQINSFNTAGGRCCCNLINR